MSILHIVNKSPYERNSVALAVDYMRDGDTLLLIEDAVYTVMQGGRAASIIDGRKAVVLGPDLAARGIAKEKMIDGVEVVDYAGFVDLVEASDKTQSWL